MMFIFSRRAQHQVRYKAGETPSLRDLAAMHPSVRWFGRCYILELATVRVALGSAAATLYYVNDEGMSQVHSTPIARLPELLEQSYHRR